MSSTACSVPSRAARRRTPRLPFDHGEPIWRCRYDVIAGVLFAVAGALLWSTYKNPTHATTFDLLGVGIFDHDFYERAPDEVVNVLAPQEDGSIRWNGVRISHDELQDQLIYGLMQPVEPEIVFVPDPNAGYDLTLRVLSVVKRSGVTKFCFGGMEAHREFDTGAQSMLLAIETSAVSVLPRSTFAPPAVELIEPLSSPPACSFGAPVPVD